MLIDPAELADSNEVAAMLGLAHRQAVSTYRSRYPDFPEPVVDKGRQCVLWLRGDIREWDARRVTRPKRRKAAASDATTGGTPGRS